MEGLNEKLQTDTGIQETLHEIATSVKSIGDGVGISNDYDTICALGTSLTRLEYVLRFLEEKKKEKIKIGDYVYYTDKDGNTIPSVIIDIKKKVLIYGDFFTEDKDLAWVSKTNIEKQGYYSSVALDKIIFDLVESEPFHIEVYQTEGVGFSHPTEIEYGFYRSGHKYTVRKEHVFDMTEDDKSNFTHINHIDGWSYDVDSDDNVVDLCRKIKIIKFLSK